MKSIFRTIQLRLAVGLAACGFFCGQARALTLDLASETGASILFTGTGNTFSFEDTGRDFVITDVHDGVGTSLGLKGKIDGTFTISPFDSMYGTVTGSGGSLSIYDGANWLMADLDWTDIFVLGGLGGANVSGALNLTSIVYGGSDLDLLALKNAGAGIAVVSLQFADDSIDLSALVADGTTHSGTISFSNTIYADTASVPEAGSTLALLGMALLGIEGLRRKMKGK